MAAYERDYILRLIRQLAQALARIAGLKKEGKTEEALEVVRETADAIFGPMLRTLEEIDTRSAASLMGNPEKLHALAVLSAEEGDILASKGEVQAARFKHRRALELYLEEVLLSSETNADAQSAIASLRGKVDESRLPARYQAMLARR